MATISVTLGSERNDVVSLVHGDATNYRGPSVESWRNDGARTTRDSMYSRPVTGSNRLILADALH